MRDIKLLKTGIPLAMRYATKVVVKVQPSHVDQCTKVFAAGCLEPLRIRMKMCLWLGSTTLGRRVKYLHEASQPLKQLVQEARGHRTY